MEVQPHDQHPRTGRQGGAEANTERRIRGADPRRLRRPRSRVRHHRPARDPGRDACGRHTHEPARGDGDHPEAAVRPLAPDRRRGRARRVRAVAVRPGDRRAMDRRAAATSRRSGACPRRPAVVAYAGMCSACGVDPDRARRARARATRTSRRPACSAGRVDSGSSAPPGSLFIGDRDLPGLQGPHPEFLDEDKTEEMGPATRRWITRIGVVGHLARMVAFGLIGDLRAEGGDRLQPREGGGPGRCAREARAPELRPLPARLVAAGLVAFGLYSIADARYRRI